MPRQPRVYSSTGIYHIMIRGINKEKIFVKGVYKQRVINIIKEINQEVDFHIIAYCVMDNHLHLLIKSGENELTLLMKRLNIKYAMFYNYVEGRYGHVFQDRFKSEAVEDDEYFIGVLRYIHNNPVKAGITNNITDYKWCSANDYIKQESEIVRNEYLNEIYKKFKSKSEFIKFHFLDDNHVYIDTKEDESEKIASIVNRVIEDFVITNHIIDNKKIKHEQKEKLALQLLNLNLCTLAEIADYCNLSIQTVFNLNKKLKEDILKTN